jgi:hypothetical protein
MFSVKGYLGSTPVEFHDTSQLCYVASDEIEVKLGKEAWELRVVWLRYNNETGKYHVAFSNEFGVEEVHELGVLTP